MGPHLAENAREIAEQLGKHDCKGSNGWLDKWKKKIQYQKIKGQRRMTKMMFGIWMDYRHFFKSMIYPR